MLPVLLILVGFVPGLHAVTDLDLTPSLSSINNGVITGQYLDSLTLTIPPCKYAGKNVDLEYTNTITKQTQIVKDAFMVPTCDQIPCLDNPLAVNRGLGYQLSGLNQSTPYSIRYKIGSNESVPITAWTAAASDYKSIDTGLSGRSPAMIIITVLLSVAMFILLGGLVVTAAVTN